MSVLVKEGESKVVRYLGQGKVEIELKPTVYSYTYNRNGIVPESDEIRYESCKILCELVKDVGVKHSYLSYENGKIISELVYEPETFVPNDLEGFQIANLPKFAPLEVVVKKSHIGTPKHRLYGVQNFSTRNNGVILPDHEYPRTIVRFDWRNPNIGPDGKRMCDEAICDDFADFYIDVEQAKITALKAFVILESFLKVRGLILEDICFFIDQSGKTIFSEITPDCMRVKTTDHESLDKDVWRAGGSSPLLIEKWRLFLAAISTPS